MDSGGSTRALPRVGFPIRKSPDQRMVSSFPGLIAAAHVLHRLLAPRHPPCALRHLTRKNTFYCRYGVFKVRVGSSAHEKIRPLALSPDSSGSRAAGLSKLNSVNAEFDVVPGEPVPRTAKWPSTSSGAYRSKCSGIP